MKTKVFLTSFALAAATGSMFVACNNEDFVTENNGSIEQSGMIELSENFMISASGVGNASTRTHWEMNKEGDLINAYIPVIATPGNNMFGNQSVLAPSIGLCWIGNGGAGEQVYTNYEFFHNGWLGKDQKAQFNPCDESELTTGWLYSDLAFADGYKVPTEGEAFSKVDNLKEVKGGKKDAEGHDLGIKDLDLNSGVYKTCNKAIFGGQYIAYYPYNKNFKDAGAIPATSIVEFKDMEPYTVSDLQLSDNTFRYSSVATITGGQQAEGFGFKNLSGVVRIVLKGAAEKPITKVMLYSPSSSFVKEVLLSPAKIAAGATGTELYSKVVATNKTILVNMADGQELTVVAANASDFKDATVYLTALPAKITDLVVMVQDTDKKWAEYKVGNFEIVAGEGRELVATYAKTDFKQVYYAVDQTTLDAAITECKAASLSANKKATIKVLGDITLSNDVTVPAYLTIEGDKVIVPEGQELTMEDNSAIKSEVIVEGESCCSRINEGGKMIVKGATIDGNVTVLAGENAKVAEGSIVFAATTTKAVVNSVIETVSDVDFQDYSNVEIFGTLTMGKEATATVAESSVVAVKGGTVNNNGTFEVLGDFSMLDAQGSTVAAAGKNFINNGTFIDNVGAKVGGATQYMTFGEKGDYICKVDSEDRMNEAYENKTACSTIDIIGGNTYQFPIVKKHTIRGVEEDVDIIVSNSNTTFNPNKSAITIGNLTIKSNADLTISKTVVSGGKKYFITVDGNIKADGKLTLSDEVLDFTVNGDITVAADFTVGEDVARMTANNLTVTKGTTMFKNRVESLDKTLEVSNTIEVKKGATFTIVAKADSKNIAYVTCTKLVEGGTFNGKPNVVE